MIGILLWTLLGGEPARKLPPETQKEISAAIVAVDKALGLESWPTHGVKPCIDRGGTAGPGKTVGAEETRKCAQAAIEGGFSGLGKSYLLVIVMGPVGPSTVFAVGIGPAEGWGARSCDPERKTCPPVRMEPTNKWGKRLVEVLGRACAEKGTIWLPDAGKRACPGEHDAKQP